MLKLINALFAHAWLAIKLKHHGAGLPTQLPAAAGLVSLYILLSFCSMRLDGTFKVESLVALSFISQLYVFCLRDKVIGLMLLIGIINNLFSLVITQLVGKSDGSVVTLYILELVMITGALVNVIKNDARVI